MAMYGILFQSHWTRRENELKFLWGARQGERDAGFRGVTGTPRASSNAHPYRLYCAF